MMRLSLPALLLAALALGGCGSDDPPGSSDGSRGRPLSIPTQPSTATSLPPSSSSSESGPAPTTDLLPCDLLDEADTAALAVGLNGPDELGGARTCEWQGSGHYTVQVAVWDHLTVEEVQSLAPARRTTIGGRVAVRLTGPLESCGYALDVQGTARVDAVSSAGGDLGLACRTARRAAQLVEPRLP